MLEVSLKAVFLNCLFWLYAMAVMGQQSTIDARIVDADGNPVAKANVYLYPLPPKNATDDNEESIDYLTLFTRTNSEGKLRFNSELERFALCSTYPIEEKVFFAPLLPDFNCRSSNVKIFQPNMNENTFLGDIKISFNYQKIELTLFDEKQGFILSQQKTSPTLWLKLRDEKYYHIVTAKVPLSSINLNNSTMQLYLPEGYWKIEFSLDEKQKAWSCAIPLVVPSKHTSQPISQDLTLKFQVNRKKLAPSEARAVLERMGIEYTLASLFDRAYDGNEEVVRLFLESGFDPNSVGGNNNTVLMNAVKFPEIVKMLLEAGAEVNQRTDEGNTALMMAVVGKSIKSVELLLKAGASVNEKNNEGKTPLMFAVEEDNKEIVKMLLRWGAKKNIKNLEGKTAVDIARELGRKKILKILNAYK